MVHFISFHPKQKREMALFIHAINPPPPQPRTHWKNPFSPPSTFEYAKRKRRTRKSNGCEGGCVCVKEGAPAPALGLMAHFIIFCSYAIYIVYKYLSIS